MLDRSMRAEIKHNVPYGPLAGAVLAIGGVVLLVKSKAYREFNSTRSPYVFLNAMGERHLRCRPYFCFAMILSLILA